MPPLPERPHSYLQENLLALLCHSDAHGKLIANLVEPELFEGDYREIAEVAIAYWRTHKQAPKSHTADLLGDILSDPNNRRAPTFRRILISLVELADSVNVTYVLDSIQTFIRTQKIKAAILQSAERINNNQEMAVPQIEELWQDLLRAREILFDPGLRLNDIDRIVSYYDQHRTVEFRTGIAELDHLHIVPERGKAFLFLAAAKKGKTWFLCSVGKEALLARKKVLHISLEINEEETAQRYFQNMFAVSKREIGDTKSTQLNISEIEDEKTERTIKALRGFVTIDVDSDFTFNSPYLRDELMSRMGHLGTRFDNLIIKQFPTRSLTANGLRAYLDNLETTENFVPDLLILDYIGIMHTDPRHHRIHLGRNFEDFRAVCVERNVAGITAHQLSKEGERAHGAGRHHVAEDWSLIGTCDVAVIYSQTEAEKQFNLARLKVDTVRSEESGFWLLISQNYKIGQFCLQSIMLNSKYEKMLDELTKDSDDEEEYDPEDDDD